MNDLQSKGYKMNISDNQRGQKNEIHMKSLFEGI